MTEFSLSQRVGAVCAYIRFYLRLKSAIAMYRLAKKIGAAADAILAEEEARLRQKGAIS